MRECCTSRLLVAATKKQKGTLKTLRMKVTVKGVSNLNKQQVRCGIAGQVDQAPCVYLAGIRPEFSITAENNVAACCKTRKIFNVL